jgi:phosphotransferase system  glucose/maltose/N-acetylglucosamine-specific IIC component
VLRREVERVDNAPGYGNPPPWSLRGILTLYALMVVINVPVAALASRLDKTSTYASSVVVVSPFLYLLYGLLAMGSARRLAGEERSMRPLETLSAAALMYVVYVLSLTIAIQLSGHNVDTHDAKQMAGAGVAGLIGGAVGAVIYPLLYRRFYMHRMPRGRR